MNQNKNKLKKLKNIEYIQVADINNFYQYINNFSNNHNKLIIFDGYIPNNADLTGLKSLGWTIIAVSAESFKNKGSSKNGVLTFLFRDVV